MSPSFKRARQSGDGHTVSQKPASGYCVVTGWLHYDVAYQDIPNGPVVKISPSSAGGVGSILVGELRSYMPYGQKTKHKTEAILEQIQCVC